MHPDGTVYHRYGTRETASATSHLSLPSLVRLLQRGLASHEAYRAAPRPPERPPRTLDDIPAWAEKVAERERAGKPIACYHCHFVFDAEREQAQAEGSWTRARIWRWPPPRRVGLELHPDEQERVTRVLPDSPAARAGLRVGDRLQVLDGQRLLSHADLSWVLERTPDGARALGLSYLRGDAPAQTTLRLDAGWKVGTPLEFAWRPSKWQLHPRPGFGGRELKEAEKRELGLDPAAMAFRVRYLVTWGPDPRYGRAAQKAGIRKDDLILGVEGAELKHVSHFHAWWRLTREPGQVVTLRLRREGEERTVELRVSQ